MDAVFIAFVSGKGGTGKSTTAVFLAEALAAQEKNVLLMELDFGLRSVDIIAGTSEQTVFDLADVLERRCTIEKALVQSPEYENLSILAAPYAYQAIDIPAFGLLCEAVAPRFDYILLDTAAGLGNSFEAATSVANRVVLVLTPDAVALRDGRLVADRLDGGKAQLRVIFNRVPRAGGYNLDAAIDTVGLQLLGVVPDSPAIQKAAEAGRPLGRLGDERAIYNAIAARTLGKAVPLQFQ